MRMTKQWVTLLVALGFLLFCGVSLAMSWRAWRTLSQAGWRPDQIRVSLGSGESAAITQTLEIPGSAPRKLVLEAGFGDVKLRGGDGTDLRVRLTKRAERGSRTEAASAAKALQVEVVRDGDLLRLISPPQPTRQGGLHLGSMNADRIDYDISLPAGTEVDLGLEAGGLDLEGLRAAATVRSSFGDLRLRRVQGAVSAELGSGSIDAAEIGSEAAAVSLKSRFGDVRASDVRGALTLRTESGALSARRVQAGRGAVILESRFGDIDLEDITAGDLTVENQTGSTDLTRIRAAGRLTLTGRFGDQRLSDVDAASALLEHGSGGLDWSKGRIKTRLEITGGLGDIALSDVLGATMTVTGGQSGNVRIGLPADADLAVRLETDAGEIDSDFDLTEAAQERGRMGRTLSGTLGSGAGRLEVSGRVGDIHLQRLPAGAR